MTDSQFWDHVFIAAIGNGCAPDVAAAVANESLELRAGVQYHLDKAARIRTGRSHTPAVISTPDLLTEGWQAWSAHYAQRPPTV